MCQYFVLQKLYKYVRKVLFCDNRAYMEADFYVMLGVGLFVGVDALR